MKKITLLLFSLIIGALVLQSCEDEDDKAVPVNDFIWKGLNLYYLWQQDVPNLNDNKFSNQSALNDFLATYGSPEELFESLLYKRGDVDRWSVIFSDFHVLENALQGIVKSNGVEYGLLYTDSSQTTVFGYVRYILPDSDAATKDIQRGDIFYAVNGTTLTADNYRTLLGADSYTLNLADYNSGALTPNGQEVALTKAQYAENPVYLSTVLEQGSHKIGYLMYNGFYSDYDTQLNTAIGSLKAGGITDLVLDLRYNGGGSVRTAGYLASMITGQFDGQVFTTQQWNEKLQAYYEKNNPSSLITKFQSKLSDESSINKLKLNKVYILTSASTASASELVINCLKPYINVVVIGYLTTGKNVGSVTLYDSPDYSSSNRDGSHTYAMQPIVLRTVNKEGFGDYSNGISPDIWREEDMENLGVLGTPTEPLLATAIAQITSTDRSGNAPRNTHKLLKDSKSILRFGNEMYIDEMPQGSIGLNSTLK